MIIQANENSDAVKNIKIRFVVGDMHNGDLEDLDFDNLEDAQKVYEDLIEEGIRLSLDGLDEDGLTESGETKEDLIESVTNFHYIQKITTTTIYDEDGDIESEDEERKDM